MKTMTDFELGKSIGKWAFERNLPATPALDSELKPLIKNPEVVTLEALKGWNEGWHEANLAAPVVLENGEILSMGH
jgi:hypothetical protein